MMKKYHSDITEFKLKHRGQIEPLPRDWQAIFLPSQTLTSKKRFASRMVIAGPVRDLSCPYSWLKIHVRHVYLIEEMRLKTVTVINQLTGGNIRYSREVKPGLCYPAEAVLNEISNR